MRYDDLSTGRTIFVGVKYVLDCVLRFAQNTSSN